MRQALADAGELLTLASRQADFADWRRGRACYAVWALDLDVPRLRARSERCRQAMTDYLLPGYARQAHATVALCGFPAVGDGAAADDYPARRLGDECAALRRAAIRPFAIEVGAPASFSSAAYFALADPAGAIGQLRRALAADAAESADFRYVPHVTFGLYRDAFPLAGVLAELAALDDGSTCRLPIDRLVLMTYAAAVVGGPLERLAEYDLAGGGLRVTDAGRMASLFGGDWQTAVFA